MEKTNHYKRRLLKLASFLDALPPEKFNYRRWTYNPKTREGISLDDLNVCGTTACALGWATSIKEFKDLGLSLDTTWYHPCLISGGDKYAAGNKIFGLDTYEFEYLFYPCNPSLDHGNLPDAPLGNATAKEVAEHIRNFIKYKYKN